MKKRACHPWRTFSMVVSVAASMPVAQPANASDARLKVALLDLKAVGVDETISESILDVYASGIHRLGCCTVVSSSEIGAMLGFEKKRQLLHCSEEASCVAEIAGSLGVDYLALGSIGRVGDTFVLNLKLVDARKAVVEGRYTDRVGGAADRLLDAMERGVPALFEPILAARGKAAAASAAPPQPRTEAVSSPTAPSVASSPIRVEVPRAADDAKQPASAQIAVASTATARPAATFDRPSVTEAVIGSQPVSRRTWIGAGLGAGGLGSISAAIFHGIKAFQAAGSRDRALTDDTRAKLATEADTARMIAIVSGITGAALAGAGAYLLLWHPGEKPKGE